MSAESVITNLCNVADATGLSRENGIEPALTLIAVQARAMADRLGVEDPYALRAEVERVLTERDALRAKAAALTDAIAAHNAEMADGCADRRARKPCYRHEHPSPAEGGKRCHDCPLDYALETS